MDSFVGIIFSIQRAIHLDMQLPIQFTPRRRVMYSSRRGEGCAEVMLFLLAIPAIVVVSALANGFVLTKLWSWFITPVFDLPALSLVPAIGLGLVVSFLTYQYTNSQSSKNDKSLMEVTISATLTAIIRPAFILLFGWFVQLFM